MKNVNIWYLVWMAFVGVVLAFCDLGTWQYAVLLNMFLWADLIGGPTKRAVDVAKWMCSKGHESGNDFTNCWLCNEPRN